MKKIGLLSDTHGYFDDKLMRFFAETDEIWHAGDIGSLTIVDTIANFKPLRAVYGNIDGHDLRAVYPETLRFYSEEVDVFITHIGGHPKKYAPQVKSVLTDTPPALFICGHSHILRVMYDSKLNMLYINPGAAGKYGFHTVRTAIRFTIDGTAIKDLEIAEWTK